LRNNAAMNDCSYEYWWQVPGALMSLNPMSAITLSFFAIGIASAVSLLYSFFSNTVGPTARLIWAATSSVLFLVCGYCGQLMMHVASCL